MCVCVCVGGWGRGGGVIFQLVSIEHEYHILSWRTQKTISAVRLKNALSDAMKLINDTYIDKSAISVTMDALFWGFKCTAVTIV